MRSLNQKHDCRVTELAPEVTAIFAAYDWPGNVRELRNVLERAVILCGSGTITAAHLPRSFAGRPAASTRPEPGVSTALEARHDHCGSRTRSDRTHFAAHGE